TTERMSAASRSEALSVESPPTNWTMRVRAAPTIKTSGVLDIGMPLEKREETRPAGGQPVTDANNEAANTPARRYRNGRIVHEPARVGTRAGGVSDRGRAISARASKPGLLPLGDQFDARSLREPLSERRGQV